MESARWWLLLLAAVMFSMSGCATTGEWIEHPAHFALSDHLAFSIRTHDPQGHSIRDADLERAREEGWWGVLVPPGPPIDVSGAWSGQWEGRGIFANTRGSGAEAQFTQDGDFGIGRIWLSDTVAAEVPWIIRMEGSRGVRVVYRVSGSEMVARHPEGGLMTVAFTLVGDRLIGTFPSESSPVVITLTRRP